MAHLFESSTTFNKEQRTIITCQPTALLELVAERPVHAKEGATFQFRKSRYIWCHLSTEVANYFSFV